MTTVEILRAARARIDTPDKWTNEGVYYKIDHSGKSHDQYCALGALGCAVGERRPQQPCHDARVAPALHALQRALGVEYPNEVFKFNDSHTHAEVMALFDRAIANEEARAQEFTAEPVVEPVPVAA